MLKHTKIVIAAEAALGLVLGIFSSLLGNNSNLYFTIFGLMTLVSLFLIFYWYVEDSKNRNYVRSKGLNLAILLLAIIGLPYYLFRTRGFKGGLLAVFCAIAIYGLHLVMGITGLILTGLLF